MGSRVLLVVCMAAVAACEQARDLEGDGRRIHALPPGSPVRNTTVTEALDMSAPKKHAECESERVDEGSDYELDNHGGPSGEGACHDNLPRPRDIYRALTLGTDDEKAGASVIVLSNRHAHARTVVSRAIAVATKAPTCSHLRPLTDTLRDCSMDVATRAGAALALGTIAERAPCLFPPSGSCPAPHDPLPMWARKVLERCTTKYPIAVARACTEALGYLTEAEVPLLRTLRDNPSNDPALRVFAGRALTRLTGTPQVTDTSLADLISTAKRIGQ